ncbi:DUF6923 family protein [Chryseobacterium sp. SIMBA_038]|uniref:DUF6923 family protein n=4 Tax=Pseudomonadati TaxID=3379134 RepID=UPI00397A6733
MKFKIYFDVIKVLTMLLLSCMPWAGTIKAQVTCSGGTTNIPRSGSVVVNGVTISTSYSGDVQNYPYSYSVCSGNVSTSANSLFVGEGNPSNPATQSPWSITLNFNKAVNNLVVVLTATGSGFAPSWNENFIFNSNGGAVSITAGTNCYSTISGNTIYSGGGAPVQANGGGGGLFKITSPSAYTTLTISGNGGLNGTLMAVCGLSIQPACNAGTTGPKVTSTLNNTCPATSANLTTAHTGTTPSGTSLVWYKNNTHTGTPLTATEVANATAGTYYAFYFDATNNCYSPVSYPVTVSILNCCASIAAPSLNNTSVYSNVNSVYTIVCGSTTANLSTLAASNTPSGSILTWHTNSVATAANRVNPVTSVSGTTKLYASFYNSSASCYSTTKMVTIAAPICAVDDDYSSTPIIAGVGGTLPSIFGNDTYNGINLATMPANSVDFFYELWTPGNATVDGNGNLIIPATTPPGSYTYIYKICDKDPDISGGSNCSLAQVTFKVVGAFGCNSNMYLSQSDKLYNVGTSTNPFTYPLIGTSSVNYNAIGINPSNGIMYGMQNSNSSNLLMINTDGTSVNLGSITGLPASTYFAGEIDHLGNYFIKSNVNDNLLYKINLTTKTATLITLSANLNIPDFAYNITTGLLYGVNATNGQLVSINPSTGSVTGIGATSGAANYGAMYSSSTGELFGVNNAGGFYQFNLTTGQRVLISDAAASSGNDGAHCVTAPITFSTDLSITKTDGSNTFASGTSTTYTIIVKNNGPFGVLNAVVEDSVPAGIPAANVSYTAVASSGSTTTVTGVQTGAINDIVNLPMGGTVTYSVVINIPFAYTGSLINIAKVTVPSNITDTNTVNNTAIDEDTQSVCYKPATTSGGQALISKIGITSLNRGTAQMDNWPAVRKGAWLVLEARTKGFVLNRVAFDASGNPIGIPASNFVEGMMVYDVTNKCLKLYTSTDGGNTFNWKCLTSQTCPD